jgi:cbb3-type cytochrome oxidase subunit 3
MAMALLLATALALVGFVFTSVQGFAVTAGPLVTRHVSYAIPTVLFSLFSQSMVVFFFIGTGKLVKDEAAGLPEADRAVVHAALRRFKMQTSPPATLALLCAIAVFVLGGAAHTRALPSWVHLGSAVAAVAVHIWAFAAESRAFAENNRLMDDPKAYARAARAVTARPAS